MGGGGLIAIAGGVAASMISDQIYSTIKTKVDINYGNSSVNSLFERNSAEKLNHGKTAQTLPQSQLEEKIIEDIQNNLSNENLRKTKESLHNLNQINLEN